MKNESDGKNNCDLCTWNHSQKLGKGTGGVRNRGMSQDHPNYNITEIRQNIKNRIYLKFSNFVCVCVCI